MSSASNHVCPSGHVSVSQHSPPAVSCTDHCYSQDLLGKAVLTIDKQGPETTYFITFSPILSCGSLTPFSKLAQPACTFSTDTNCLELEVGSHHPKKRNRATGSASAQVTSSQEVRLQSGNCGKSHSELSTRQQYGPPRIRRAVDRYTPDLKCAPRIPPKKCEILGRYGKQAYHQTQPYKFQPILNDRSGLQENSRKGMPWLYEEEDLLICLRRDCRLPWPDVTQIFSEQFPGRSQGSIQVYWSTNLRKRL